MGFVDPPEMPAEPDYDGDYDYDYDYDYDGDARERELMLDDLADDNDGSFKPNNFFLVASTE